MLFLLFVSTYVFQVGLVSVIMREFRTMIAVAAIYFVVFVIYGAVKLVSPVVVPICAVIPGMLCMCCRSSVRGLS
jgi:hypothetical protein